MMCRKLALAATALVVLSTQPALAWGVGKPAAPAAAPAEPAPAKATAQDRAQDRAAADRMDPLGRAAFWGAQVNADPKDAEAGIKLAAALRALGRFQEAYGAAQAVLVLQPNNIDALLETARTAISDSQGFFAVAPARKVIALAPKDWRGPTLLAVGLEQAGRIAEAQAAHAQAMALAPANPTVLSNAALFYAAQGDRPRAETLLRKAAAAPGAGLQVRQNLALILGLQGKLVEAEALQRQDLPPQMVANNIAYLKTVAAPAPAAN